MSWSNSFDEVVEITTDGCDEEDWSEEYNQTFIRVTHTVPDGYLLLQIKDVDNNDIDIEDGATRASGAWINGTQEDADGIINSGETYELSPDGGSLNVGTLLFNWDHQNSPAGGTPETCVQYNITKIEFYFEEGEPGP